MSHHPARSPDATPLSINYDINVVFRPWEWRVDLAQGETRFNMDLLRSPDFKVVDSRSILSVQARFKVVIRLQGRFVRPESNFLDYTTLARSF